jgi:hypothetical protein
MLRATIGLLALTVSAAEAGEITLSCDGVASHMFRPGKERVASMSLIVDLADRSVIWDGSRIALDRSIRGLSDEHTLYFGNSADADQIKAQGLERPKGPFYFLDGSIDRVTGRTRISQGAIRLDKTYPDETTYNLLCKPVKPLF